MCRGTDDKWRVVGVSLNTNCDGASANHPFMRLSSFQSFISESIALDGGKFDIKNKTKQNKTNTLAHI